MLSAARRKISFFGIPPSVAQISPKVILTLTFKKQKALDLGPITLVWGVSLGHKRMVPFSQDLWILIEFLLFLKELQKHILKYLSSKITQPISNTCVGVSPRASGKITKPHLCGITQPHPKEITQPHRKPDCQLRLISTFWAETYKYGLWKRIAQSLAIRILQVML